MPLLKGAEQRCHWLVDKKYIVPNRAKSVKTYIFHSYEAAQALEKIPRRDLAFFKIFC